MTSQWGAAVVLPAALSLMFLTGCTSSLPADVEVEDSSSQSSAGPGRASQTAQRLLQVTEVHEATGMTLLEGPVFGTDGHLYVVDVTAPAGEPKVLRIDIDKTTVEPVYSDESGVFTSAQFGEDGRLYLTDFVGGGVVSITAEGGDLRREFDGPVEGVAMHPDDLAFDDDGNVFITDTAGYLDPYWEATGRLIRIDRETSTATVLASELPAPNGIAFTPDYDGLWVSQNTGNTIDHLRLSADGTEVATAHPAMHVDGGIAQVDSLAVDAAGNVYAGLHNRAAIVVYAPTGEMLGTIAMPEGDGVTSATNVAIVPGGREAYATVSGPAGGFIYTFEALAEGIPQSQ